MLTVNWLSERVFNTPLCGSDTFLQRVKVSVHKPPSSFTFPLSCIYSSPINMGLFFSLVYLLLWKDANELMRFLKDREAKMFVWLYFPQFFFAPSKLFSPSKS